jgi:hypothetical protein
VWRGRLYTVRAILEHWIVNREWWQDSDPLGSSGPPAPEPAQPRSSHPEAGRPEPAQPEPAQPEPAQPEPGHPELEFWRVEASPGQGMATGVYELRRDAASDAWTLRLGAP